MKCFAGPLSSILSTKYSYRTVTLIGGTFAASGMMLSYFANSVTYLYVRYRFPCRLTFVRCVTSEYANVSC